MHSTRRLRGLTPGLLLGLFFGAACDGSSAPAVIDAEAPARTTLNQSSVATPSLESVVEGAAALVSGSAEASARGALAASTLLARPAVLGASAAAGFQLDFELGAATDLADYVRAALHAEHLASSEVLGLGDGMFFLAPARNLDAQLARAAEFGASALIAPDLLFWFLYGPDESEELRLPRLEGALDVLTAIDTPLVVGTIPLMDDADPIMLAPDWIPRETTIASANRRIVEWTDARSHVARVELGSFIEATLMGEAVHFRGASVDDSIGDFLQDDGLHPTSLGTSLMTLMSLDGLESLAGPAHFEGLVNFDPLALHGAIESR